MENSSAEEPVVAQRNGEEISAPSASPISIYLENKNLTEKFKSAQGRIVALEGLVNTLEIKLCRAAGLLVDQQKKLDPEYTFPFLQEEEEGSGRGNDEEDNPIDIKVLKSFLAQETTLRLDAEDKTRELESLTEEYNLFINELKEHLMEKDEQQNSPSTSKEQQQSSSSFEENQKVPSLKEELQKVVTSVKERLAHYQKESMELKREVSETKENSEKLVEQINSLQLKRLTAPPEKMSAETQTNEVPKDFPILPVAVGTAVTAMVPTQEQEQKDGNAAILEQIPGKSKQVEPEVITLDDSPPVSPQPIPIDSEGNSAEYISAVPNSSSDVQLGQFQRSHEFDRKDEISGLLLCKCGKDYRTEYNLHQHIYYYQIRQKIGCPYCMRRFPFDCSLKKHLKEIHSSKIGANGVARSSRRVQSQRRSVKCAEKIKPRKNAVKRRKLAKKMISVRKVSGAGTVNQMNNKVSPHRQVSRSSSDNYACACGVQCARKPDLEEHIAKMKKKC